MRLLVLLLAFYSLIPSIARADAFEWWLDPTTGNAVAQLTTWDASSTAVTQDNYALYYHQPNQSADGRFLVYRHTECVCPSTGCTTRSDSVAYRRLDLETGAEIQLLGTGLASGAVVHDQHLYVATRDTASGPYQRIDKIDLETAVVTCVTQLPAGEDLSGSLTINADGTTLIYQTRTPTQTSGGSTWAHFLDPAAVNTCSGANVDLLLNPYDPGIEHIHFSPSDPDVFTFIDQGATQLARLGIGTVTSSTSTWNILASDQDYFQLFYGYPHPFWDADGHLWTDAIGPSSTAPHLSEAFVRLQIDEDTGWVNNYQSVEMTADDWHHHQAGQRSLGWFVGDGQILAGRPDAGVPWISLFHLEPPTGIHAIGGTLERHELADSLGAENGNGGNGGANAHLLTTLDGVVFAAPYDSATGESSDVSTCPASRNIFLIKIPEHLKARLDDNILGGNADGPFKHAHRLSVEASGNTWSIDYGSGGATPGLGDGVVDRTAGAITVSSDHVGLADLNGDDVDDRLAFTQTASGWQIDVAYTPYDGLLPTAAVTADSTRSFDDASSLAPIFGDLNGDGRDDMVRLDDTGPSVLWQGRFSADVDLPASPYVPLGLPWETASAFGDPSTDEHFFAVDVDGDGYADRVTVRPYAGGWIWRLDLSTASGFGDGVVDDTFIGASNATDHPLVADVDADGRADIVIAREQGGQLRWYVNPSSGGGFGSSWDPPAGRGFFGAIGQPLIGVFSRFQTVQP